MIRQQIFTAKLSAVLMFFAVAAAVAQAPELFSYQGRLLDDSGKPVDGPVTILFAIYDDSTAGTMLWTDTYVDLEVNEGLVSVVLSLEEQPVAFNQYENLFLAIKIGDDPELSPRTRLVASPLSLRVATVDGASGGTINGVVEIDDRLSVGPNHTNTGKHSFTVGSDNIADQDYASISGGKDNSATGMYAVVGGGLYNHAQGAYATISGGLDNIASGLYSAVLGTTKCVAQGDYSVAIGNRAKAFHDGSVVIAAHLCPT